MGKYISCKKIFKCLNNLKVDPELSNYKGNLICLDDFKKMVVLNNQFFYIYDISEQKIIYVSENFENLLGYNCEELTLPFIYDIIHKDDKDFVIKATLAMLKEGVREINSEPLMNLFCIDYRLKKSDGSYIRMLRQTGMYKKDKLGNLLLALSNCYEIIHTEKG